MEEKVSYGITRKTIEEVLKVYEDERLAYVKFYNPNENKEERIKKFSMKKELRAILKKLPNKESTKVPWSMKIPLFFLCCYYENEPRNNKENGAFLRLKRELEAEFPAAVLGCLEIFYAERIDIRKNVEHAAKKGCHKENTALTIAIEKRDQNKLDDFDWFEELDKINNKTFDDTILRIKLPPLNILGIEFFNWYVDLCIEEMIKKPTIHHLVFSIHSKDRYHADKGNQQYIILDCLYQKLYEKLKRTNVIDVMFADPKIETTPGFSKALLEKANLPAVLKDNHQRIKETKNVLSIEKMIELIDEKFFLTDPDRYGFKFLSIIHYSFEGNPQKNLEDEIKKREKDEARDLSDDEDIKKYAQTTRWNDEEDEEFEGLSPQPSSPRFGAG